MEVVYQMIREVGIFFLFFLWRVCFVAPMCFCSDVSLLIFILFLFIALFAVVFLMMTLLLLFVSFIFFRFLLVFNCIICRNRLKGKDYLTVGSHRTFSVGSHRTFQYLFLNTRRARHHSLTTRANGLQPKHTDSVHLPSSVLPHTTFSHSDACYSDGSTVWSVILVLARRNVEF